MNFCMTFYFEFYLYTTVHVASSLHLSKAVRTHHLGVPQLHKAHYSTAQQPTCAWLVPHSPECHRKSIHGPPLLRFPPMIRLSGRWLGKGGQPGHPLPPYSSETQKISVHCNDLTWPEMMLSVFGPADIWHGHETFQVSLLM